MQAITQADIEAVKAAKMAVKEVENPVNTTRSVQGMSKTGSLAVKSLNFTGEQATNTKNYDTLR